MSHTMLPAAEPEGARAAPAPSSSIPIPTWRRFGWLAAPMVLSFVSLYCVSLTEPTARDGGVPSVRVWLKKLQGETALTFESAQPISVETMAGRSLTTADVLRHTLSSHNGELRLDGQRIDVRQVVLRSADPLQSQGRSYRGSLVVSVDEGRLRTINHIDLEDYLSGVVGSEIPALSARESLKAQAVAARTYTLWRMAQNSRRAYDLTDDTYSQVYAGALDISERVLAAVHATRGEVLSFEGKFLPSYYHSTCGGHTSDQRVGFGSGREIDPLRGVTCGYCTSSRYYSWTASLSRADVDQKLAKEGGRVQAIRPLERDDLGRWWKVEIETEKGRREISANGLRMALGPNQIRGTLIEGLRLEGDQWVIRGRGWGHGVGLCQVGAMTLGREGWSYRQILEHYYPGASLRRAPAADAAGWHLVE